jgi:uncharacterized protein (DUF433 family)
VDGSDVEDSSLVGIGLYTVPDAARLTGIPQPRLGRWLRAYTNAIGKRRAASHPVWQRQLPEVHGMLGLGFLDLMEARFVDAFRKAAVPWRVIRHGAERAREIFDTDHPFSSQRFRTDGRTIFAGIIDATGEPQLFTLVKSQLAFARVVGRSLYAGIEFSNRDMPVRWWPLGRHTPVVIDPARSFGQPIVSAGGVPTAVLANAVAAEGSVAKVARLFRWLPQSVGAALRFEQRAGWLRVLRG